ncbi:MAG: 50S ribosomal protein L23 [Candidatus Portnoybacteria bacterium]|nr:50S ribosomal protein L23 [Candidatus Portnoybacteria bacterium]
MSIFNKIKKEIKGPKEEEKKEKTKKVSGKKTVSKIKKTDKGQIYKVLKNPHISEKATDLGEKGKYTFEIFPYVNKNQVRRAVSDLYGVHVDRVNIINIKPKKRILRGIEGKKSGYKKAIVTLKKGEKIEIMPH